MAWQEVFPLNVSRIDAEEERELRLAAQARAGAEWALSALVARYQPPVTRYLTRLTGDAQVARLLAERIFVQMEKRLHGPHAGEHLRLWLLRACTEAGLDALRHPHRGRAALRLDSPHMAGLLPERAGEATAGKLRAGLGALASLTGSTSRQVRQLIWSTEAEMPHRAPKPAPTLRRASAKTKQAHQPQRPPQQQMPPFTVTTEEDPAQQDPREALRYRMVRAVLAEIPYGDAQCLALHLIAGLNQAEVAQALGITPSATRRRIVQGLQLFAQRYEAAAASLGFSMEALSPAATHPSPLAEAPLPLEDITTAPLPDVATKPVDAFSPPPIEEPRTVIWETPFMVTPRVPALPALPVSPPPVTTIPLYPVPEPEQEMPPAAAGAIDVGDEEQALILAEREGAPLSRDEEHTPIIVDTTAVVEANPVAELSLVDTAILPAPAVSVGHDPVALRLTAVEVAAQPPEATAVEQTSEEPAQASIVAARSAPALSLASAALPPVRVVPVLTREAQATAAQDTLAMPEGHAEAHTAAAVRVVPVLTPVMPMAPAASINPVVRSVERPSSGASALAADEVVTDILDARRTPVVLPAERQDGAAVEAHVEAQ